jgi:hypothetical protein
MHALLSVSLPACHNTTVATRALGQEASLCAGWALWRLCSASAASLLCFSLVYVPSALLLVPLLWLTPARLSPSGACVRFLACVLACAPDAASRATVKSSSCRALSCTSVTMQCRDDLPCE